MKPHPLLLAPLWSGLGLVAPMQARVSGGVPEGAAGISIDTRTLAAGDLFFAIAGDNSNGHDHVAQAFENGAAAAVVDEAHAESLRGLGPLYVVGDVLQAMQRLGLASRARTRARIAAVTGSVGKTSTKDALALVLASDGATHASAASYNNHWGVPLTLARMPQDSRFGVFEIGMNHAGEITPLVAQVQPHVAIVTTVAPVHLEHFGSLEAIADAKAEIFSGLAKGGVAIINRDIAQYQLLLEAARASPARHVLGFGEHEEAEARLESVEVFPEGTYVQASVLGQRLRYRMAAPGRHFAENSLAVLLAARAMGMDLAKAALALEQFRPTAGRGQRAVLHTPQGPFTLIDESYNANPASMRAALAVLGTLALDGTGRRIAVLGDMLELGSNENALHAELAQVIGDEKIDLVFAAGPRMRHLYDALPVPMQGGWSASAELLQPIVVEAVRAGDVVMAKGSNGSRMGPLVKALVRNFPQQAGGGHVPPQAS